MKTNTKSDDPLLGSTFIKDNVNVHLPGERWKMIPGFEDLYQVSNFGRVRSLSYWLSRDKQWLTYKKGRLLKLRLPLRFGIESPVAKKADPRMVLYRQGRRTSYSVARFVYYLFIDQFYIYDRTVRIVPSDGDSWNLHAENLRLEKIR